MTCNCNLNGGMALTAEEWADVRIVLGLNGSQDIKVVLDAQARLRALFPATEPAEEAVGDPLQAWKEFLKPKPISWYRTMTPQFATEHFGFPGVIGSKGFWTHTASDGGKWAWDGDDWELREYPPALAEPTEEETKAEECAVRSPQGDTCSFPEPGHAGVHTWAWPDKKPTSAPVVPAPTETGPWQTWQEVPEGVWVRSEGDNGWKWIKRDGVRFTSNCDCVGAYKSRLSDEQVASLAPFVVAEAGNR